MALSQIGWQNASERPSVGPPRRAHIILAPVPQEPDHQVRIWCFFVFPFDSRMSAAGKRGL